MAFSILLLSTLLHVAAGDATRDEFDCKMRALAVEYALHLQPWRPLSTFVEIVDALNGAPEKAAGCSVTVPPGAGEGGRRFGPVAAASIGGNFSQWFVSVSGSDTTGDGTINNPFATLPRALAASRSNVGGSNQIILRAGTYYLQETVVLTPSDNGLVVQAFPGEEAWISGATPLPSLSWKPYNISNNASWVGPFADTNAVDGASPGGPFIVLPNFQNVTACAAACEANFAASGGCTIYTWHDSNQGSYSLECWLRTDGIWNPIPQSGHYSGRLLGGNMNIYVASLAGAGVSSVPGLRYNGSRLTRARYPNGFPETKGFMPPSVFRALWTPQQLPRTPDVEINMNGGLLSRNTSVSAFQVFTAGIGGTCDRFQPNAGYWCSTKVQGGGSVIYYVPIAMQADQKTLPNLPYAHPEDAIIQTWRPGHWASWMFTVSGATWNGTTANFTLAAGGFQGSRGEDQGEDSYIENVFEELDFADEYFYDVRTQNLYVFWNASSGTPPPADGFTVPAVKAVFNVTGVSQSQPIRDITITGLGIRDTAYTYMDPHSIPSGGDWTLERSAVVFIENAVGVDVTYNVFERVDGNAVLLSGFVRNTTVAYNEFAWIGATAVASWGDTDDLNDVDSALPPGYGADGTAGNQPRGNKVSYNLCRELGIWEKQSSCYTQFKSSENVVNGNIMFNGPRAHVNFNDGYRGGALLSQNLIFNSCRESGDHGPFNSVRLPANRSLHPVIVDFALTTPSFSPPLLRSGIATRTSLMMLRRAHRRLSRPWTRLRTISSSRMETVSARLTMTTGARTS